MNLYLLCNWQCSLRNSVKMGVTSSTQVTGLQSNPLLTRLVGEESIEGRDEYWQKLLTFSFSYPYGR